MTSISRCKCKRRNELRDYEQVISLMVYSQLEMVLHVYNQIVARTMRHTTTNMIIAT